MLRVHRYALHLRHAARLVAAIARIRSLNGTSLLTSFVLSSTRAVLASERTVSMASRQGYLLFIQLARGHDLVAVADCTPPELPSAVATHHESHPICAPSSRDRVKVILETTARWIE